MAKVVRNPQTVLPLADMQVLISFHDDPKIGKDGVFPAEWESVGVLNDDSSVELQRTIDKNKIKGIGFGVIAVTTKPGELTGSCETLENNESVEKVAWPGTVIHDGVKIRQHGGVPAKCHVAMVFEKQDGDFNIRVTREKAIATMENLNESEDPTGRKIDFDFQVDKDKFAFDEYIVKRGNAKVAVNPKQIRFLEAGTLDPNKESSDSKAGAGGAGTPGAGTGGVTPAPGGNPGGTQPSPSTVEVKKRIDVPDDATGGTWSLTVGDQTISDLAYNVAPTTVRSRLQALNGVEDVIVRREGTRDFSIEFTAASALSVTADGAGLTGGESTEITVSDA